MSNEAEQEVTRLTTGVCLYLAAAHAKHMAAECGRPDSVEAYKGILAGLEEVLGYAIPDSAAAPIPALELLHVVYAKIPFYHIFGDANFTSVSRFSLGNVPLFWDQQHFADARLSPRRPEIIESIRLDFHNRYGRVPQGMVIEGLPWALLAPLYATNSGLQPVPSGWPVTDPTHGLRLAKDTIGNVSFYENETKGRRRLRTSMKPGRYLKRFFPEMDQKKVERLALLIPTCTVLAFADTADEIERVYLNGPASCMSRPPDYYVSHCHPVRAYESPDLKLAYMIQMPSKRITARALVWPDKKRCGRIYGDASRMAPLLVEAGYKKVDSDYTDEYDSFDGARLKLIWNERAEGTVVVPYVDGAKGLRRDGDYLVIDPCGDIEPDSTLGHAAVDGYDALGIRYCPRLDQYFDQDEMSFIYVQCADEYWSELAVARFASYCEFSEEYTSNDTVAVVIDEAGAEQYCDEEVLSCYAFECAVTNRWYSQDIEDVVAKDTGETAALVNAKNAWRKSEEGFWFTTTEAMIEAGQTPIPQRDEHPDQIEPPIAA